MGINNFYKLEELKTVLNATLISLGMEERVRVINNEDLENIIHVMMSIETVLRKIETDSEKVDYLEKYILCLLTILQVDHGVNVKELK